MKMQILRWVKTPDMNSKGALFGGAMLSWIDEDTSLLAYENTILKGFPGEEDIELTTAGMSLVKFIKPVRLGDRLQFDHRIVHVGASSITICSQVLSREQDSEVFRSLTTMTGIRNWKPVKISHRLKHPVDKLDPMWEMVENLKKSLPVWK